MMFEFEGASLYYETHGEGPSPLLLLHGWGGACASFKPVIRDFQDEFSLVVVDFPGHGRSPEPPTPWSVTEYARLIEALMRHLGIEGADVIAHSFGARVAIWLAAHHPSRVGRVVLTGAAGIRPRPSALLRLRTRLFKGLRAVAASRPMRAILGERRTEAMIESLIRRFGSSDYRRLTRPMRATFNRVIEQDLTDCLAEIRAPVLLVWGEHDTETPLWMGRLMEERIPNAELKVLPGCGHFAYLDRYADFKIMVRRFLKQAESA